MSPGNIISEAVKKGIDIIGITDHNTTRHCNLVSRLAAEKGIFVMQGAEVTTKEEVHCLAFFENSDTLNLFQEFLDANLPDIENIRQFSDTRFRWMKMRIIIYEEKKLLVNALSKNYQGG